MVQDAKSDVTAVQENQNSHEEKKVYWPQWLACLTVSQIMFLTGLMFGWSSPYLAKLSLQDHTDGIPRLNGDELSWLASINMIGRLFGTIFGAAVQDLTGRKNLLTLCGAPMAIGWTCQALATSVDWLYAARFTCGFATGAVWTALFHYVAEIADSRIRGSLTILNVTAITVGSFTGNLMGPYVSLSLYAYIGIGFNGLYMLFMSLLPDSPYHYIMQGDLGKAEKSLKWFRRSKNVKAELAEMQAYVSSSKCTLKDRLREMRDARVQRNFLLLLLINVFTYFSAWNVVNVFMEIIATNSQMSATPSIIVTISTFLSLFGGLTAIFLVDSFGRRILLVYSSLGAASALACLGIHFKLLDLGFDPAPLTWLPCVCLFVYRISFTLGIGGIPHALVGELFSPRLKAVASLWFNGVSMIIGTLSTATYVPLLDVVGSACVFWIYAAGTFLSALYFHLCIRETKGRSLKDIQDKTKE